MEISSSLPLSPTYESRIGQDSKAHDKTAKCRTASSTGEGYAGLDRTGQDSAVQYTTVQRIIRHDSRSSYSPS
jgi:hypothetical protein